MTLAEAARAYAEAQLVARAAARRLAEAEAAVIDAGNHASVLRLAADNATRTAKQALQQLGAVADSDLPAEASP